MGRSCLTVHTSSPKLLVAFIGNIKEEAYAKTCRVTLILVPSVKYTPTLLHMKIKSNLSLYSEACDLNKIVPNKTRPN